MSILVNPLDGLMGLPAHIANMNPVGMVSEQMFTFVQHGRGVYSAGCPLERSVRGKTEPTR